MEAVGSSDGCFFEVLSVVFELCGFCIGVFRVSLFSFSESGML